MITIYVVGYRHLQSRWFAGLIDCMRLQLRLRLRGVRRISLP
jgi:hypothetical protein